MTPISTTDLIASLKARIVNNMTEAKRFRVLANEAKTKPDFLATGYPSAEFWANRRARKALRWPSRHLLLAYGFLRGRSYKQIEPKVDEGNEPSHQRILQHLKIWDAYPDQTELSDLLSDWLQGDLERRERTETELTQMEAAA